MVAADVAEIVRVLGSMGLELNRSMSELIAHQELIVNDSTLQSFMRVSVGDASLLTLLFFLDIFLTRPDRICVKPWTELAIGYVGSVPRTRLSC